MVKIFAQNWLRHFAGILLIAISFLLVACHPEKHEPTLLLNIPYHDVRKTILDNGWQPVPQKRTDHDEGSLISHFLDLGYVELDACSGTGMGYCRFIFQNDLGIFLIVTTQEAPFAGDKIDIEHPDDAVVVNYGITDKVD